MVPDGRTEWTDGRRQNYIPPTSSGDNKNKSTLRMLGNFASFFKIKFFETLFKEYCKFRIFREAFIFEKLHECGVSRT